MKTAFFVTSLISLGCFVFNVSSMKDNLTGGAITGIYGLAALSVTNDPS